MSDDLWRSRVASPLESQRRDVEALVSTRDDVLRALRRAAATLRPVRLVLTRDIMLARGIAVPAAIPRLCVDGCGLFRFVATASADYALLLPDTTPALVRDVGFAPVATGIVTASIFTATSVHVGLRLRGVDVTGATNTLDPAVTWTAVTSTELG